MIITPGMVMEVAAFPLLGGRSQKSSEMACTPFRLPSGGIIILSATDSITLTSDVLFTPACSVPGSATEVFAESGISGITDVKDPFYASVTPQVYATAAATVVAWMLVIMLLITPRTYFVGGAGGGFGILNRHGIIGGAQGSASVIGVGSRPWLQKVAALTVAISLTVVTGDTFRVAAQQYSTGFMNAVELRSAVVNGTEIKVVRIISDVFVWLAQVQTLIRLFPRHREKVLIKWIGFALIVLDSTFTTLNSFLGNPIGRPARFGDAIPALTYLFTLALSMLYAAWVMYYSIRKRKYSYYHKSMPNITLVAGLSFIALATPVIFFITDIANQSIAGWGDYFRWAGAAAASVIVWEWVERIEALEREEKKDGILGREVFDGDEMIESPDGSNEVIWPRPRGFWASQGFKRAPSSRSGGSAFASRQDAKQNVSSHHTGRTERALEYVKAKTRRSPERSVTRSPQSSNTSTSIAPPPPAAVSPVNRADTTSPASTIYAIRYQNGPTPAPPTQQSQPTFASLNQTMQDPPLTSSTLRDEKLNIEEEGDNDSTHSDTHHSRPKFHISNPFKRRKFSPPEQVQHGRVIDPVSINRARSQPTHNYSKWDFKGRVGAFAADQGEKWREKNKGDKEEKDLPVTIIPAQPRGRAWSPDSTLNVTQPPFQEPPGSSGGAMIESRVSTAVERSPSAQQVASSPRPTTASPPLPLPRTIQLTSPASRPDQVPSSPPPPTSPPPPSSPPPPWSPHRTASVSRAQTVSPPARPHSPPSEPHR